MQFEACPPYCSYADNLYQWEQQFPVPCKVLLSYALAYCRNCASVSTYDCLEDGTLLVHLDSNESILEIQIITPSALHHRTKNVVFLSCLSRPVECFALQLQTSTSNFNFNVYQNKHNRILLVVPIETSTCIAYFGYCFGLQTLI